MTQKDVNNALRTALYKYAFDVKNPTGAGLPKSLTAPKPAAAPPPAGLDMKSMIGYGPIGGGTGKPLMPQRPAATGLASASIGAAPARNNSIFSTQPGSTQPTSTPAALPAAQPNPFRQQVDPATFAQMRAQRGQASAAPAAEPQPNPFRQQVDPATFAQMRGQQGQMPTPKSHTGMGSYADVLDRWYNPWTTQQVTEKDEASLMRPAQVAAGTGAAAIGTLAAIPAATAVGLGGAGGAMTTGGAALTTGNAVANGAMVASAMPQQPDAAPPAETPAANKPTAPAQQTGQQTGQQPAAGEPAKPAAPQTPEQKQQANANLMQRMNDPNVPDADKKQAAQQHVQQMLDSNPEMKQGMADLHSGKDTPQAKAFQAEVDKAGNAYVREEFARLRQQNPTASPQQQGGMLQGIMDSYQSMPEPMKWMMGLGVGGGLLGILGSMFGGGGGMGMLGLLGLGAAGLAGAAGGMFGQGAQDMMGGMVGQLGQATGMIPKDMDLSALKGSDAMQRATNQSSGGGLLGGIKAYFNPKGEAEKVKGQLGQADQLNRLMMVPEGMRAGLMRQISPNSSPEEIQQMLSNASQMHGAMNDPKSQLGQNVQSGREFVKDPSAYVSEYTNPLKWDAMPWNWGGKSSADHGHALAMLWAKEADDKATKEWMQKFRARGQKGRWVNTRRGSKMETRVTASNN